jgi:hypothetical protein
MGQLDTSRLAAIVGRVKASGVAMVPTQILMDNYANDATGDELTALPGVRVLGPAAGRRVAHGEDRYLAQPPEPREQRQAFDRPAPAAHRGALRRRRALPPRLGRARSSGTSRLLRPS